MKIEFDAKIEKGMIPGMNLMLSYSHEGKERMGILKIDDLASDPITVDKLIKGINQLVASINQPI